MNCISLKVLIGLIALGLSNLASAQGQVVEYIECTVEDPASFIAAATRFLDSMSGGVRPTFALDETLWNGESDATHAVILEYPDHQSLEAWFDRIGENPAAWMQLMNSISASATCPSEGLAVQRGAWGDTEADWSYYAVYPLNVTDVGLYMDAFEELAEEIADDLPGSLYIFENRAGLAGVTHFAVFFSPSLAALNEYLDTLQESDDFADFLDVVGSIRTVGTATQRRRMITIEP